MTSLLTDIGLKRSLNEDSASYYENENYKIYVVADGMGGHNAGEVASEIASKKIITYVKSNFLKSDPENILKDAIKSANTEIFEYSKTAITLNGMGTTVTACLITKDFIHIANVGDSSCFGIKDGKIRKITKDHSLVQELVDSGSITEEDAVNHPKKNIITRALGTADSVDVDVFPVKQNDYDILLLCSDGLTNELSNSEILDIIYSEDEYDKITQKLVETAKGKGGRDNITVLLFKGEM
ncbi:Stp1/IreP family PP2C-type Ser/Thr phosphatase [Clostridium sp. BJN0001]|uniref:Stp1/IreP family PP2C-type Ser/Thr phosphatase n=1 Tax=Clostridium sp. BJN0001 TaxID=2930219 RepID=UPI001FD1B65B|nr:Stp1/IreP family PP2C-type Ser/Thr phosphatase [Clostridium sp. BJN0001]